MFTSIAISTMARDLATHAAARQGLAARNVANADTPGYRATDLPDFATTLNGTATALRATRPGHLGAGTGPRGADPVDAGAEPSPSGNTVSLESELLRSAGIRQQHEMALGVSGTVRDILRAALGRIR
ncbi:FlgB family protein [Palleronia sediminis]|uniref:FlgB family protein n=1 Tax=Palleronia sediminis TaxID=2547833 RepID=A0A4R5ZVD7_9RHOB|nr:FlgB family protein [Palleronia sediminis]TDL74214.1 FlgB family protein [Palleronia sediminis]